MPLSEPDIYSYAQHLLTKQELHKEIGRYFPKIRYQEDFPRSGLVKNYTGHPPQKKCHNLNCEYLSNMSQANEIT